MVILRSGTRTRAASAGGSPPAKSKRWRMCSSEQQQKQRPARWGGPQSWSSHELRGTAWEWVVDNSYIHSGYRKNMGLKQAALSLFQLHNETFNVWSHLIGVFIFVLLVAHVAWNHGIALPQQAAAPPVHVGPDHISSLVVRMVGTPLIVGGRHTPRFAAMVCLGLDEHGDNIRVAEQYFLSAEGVLDTVHASLPSLDSLRAAVRQHVASITTRGQSAVAAAMDNLDHAVNEVKRSLEQRNRGAPPPHSPETCSSAGDHIAALHSRLSDAISSLGQHAAVLESSTVDTLLDEARVIKDKLSAAAGSSRSAMNRIMRVSHAVFTEDEDHVEAYLGPLEGPAANERHVPRWPVFVFTASAIFCLGCSATFHLFYVMNREAAVLFQRVDFAGIAVLIAGSTLPILYYGFYCSMTYGYAYATFSVVVCTAALVVVAAPGFGGSEYRLLRVGSFIGAGLAGLVPMVHLLYRYGLGDEITTWVPYTLVMGALYIAGSGFYATRFPESAFPGRFDIWFSSHQIWHLCVLAAAVLHYVAVMEFFLWRRRHVCAHEPASVVDALPFFG